MTARTTGSLFVMLVLIGGIGSAVPASFADHPEVTITAVAGSGTPGGCGAGAADDGSDIDCYEPMSATVDVGGKVIFSNGDTLAHTFDSGTPPTDGGGPDGIFNSGLVLNGGSYEWEPDTAGEYPFYCGVHPWMVGKITVQEAKAMEDDDHEEMESMENPNESETPDPRDEEVLEGDALELKEEEEIDEGDMERMEDEEMEEGSMSMDGSMMEGGELMAKIEISANEAGAGDRIPIDITVTKMGDDHGGMIHLWYDLVAMQSGEVILEIEEGHSHTGEISEETGPLIAAPSDEAPITVTITSQGMAPPAAGGGAPPVEERTGEIGVVIGEQQVVPEFGSIAMMILVVSVISIVAITARSRISLRV